MTVQEQDLRPGAHFLTKEAGPAVVTSQKGCQVVPTNLLTASMTAFYKNMGY